MISSLNASNCNFSSQYYQSEFEKILCGCVVAYQAIIKENTKINNDENVIRDRFSKYLEDDSFKNDTYPLMNYQFDSESREKNGRTDIRILPINPYIGQKAYFIIECKRINKENSTGETGLNAKYIANGICRFVYGYYSTYFGFNAMFGFVVDSIDIDDNIKNINHLLPSEIMNDQNLQKKVKSHCYKNLTHTTAIDNYKFAYTSQHQKDDRNILLYHLMFDFSNIIQ